jgi:ankyrin repeat protein
MMNPDKKCEEGYIIASTLVPTVINELVEKDNLSMLKKLKKCIKNIYFRDFTKKNPLHIAAINGSYEIAKFLIKCRININEMDDEKKTPLNYACLSKHRKVALLIRDRGGILNQSMDLGNLFCSFAYEGDLDTIKLFYECGANLMMCDYDKRTVAHIASSEGKVDIIKFLVEETTFNIMVEDRWGNTPYMDASEEIKKIIEGKFRVDKLSKKKNKSLKKMNE